MSIFPKVLRANRSTAAYETIGFSREGHPIEAIRIGSGEKKISLIAGMHADEPVGPLFLRYFSAYLSTLDSAHPLLTTFDWWIVPHGNPDGERKNASWFRSSSIAADCGLYLAHRMRELPGDDLEFGFPRSLEDTESRPETRAMYQWWLSEESSFSLHISFHGMAFAGGPWFLLQPTSTFARTRIQSECKQAVLQLGYVLHDVERHGEKGFNRIAPGFCTHPTSAAMAEHFLSLGDTQTASLFRPSSMETIATLGGEPVTLVSEMPLFILPGVGLELGPPDPVAVQWREQIEIWQSELQLGIPPENITLRAEASGINAMPYDHQMELQWTLLRSALLTVAEEEMSVIDL